LNKRFAQSFFLLYAYSPNIPFVKEKYSFYLQKIYSPDRFFALLHSITVIGDHLGELKTVAEELGIPFECKDHCTHDELQTGKGM